MNLGLGLSLGTRGAGFSPAALFSVLNASGVLFTTTRNALDASGASFAVPQTVLAADGTSYSVL